MKDILLVGVISAASGAVGVVHKIGQGKAYRTIWVVGEMIAAMLTGYLAYDSYSLLDTPPWLTREMLVAAAAYSGGGVLRLINRVALKEGHNDSHK